MKDIPGIDKNNPVNRIALNLQEILHRLQKIIDQLTGTKVNNIVLLIGVNDVVQYAANVDRAHGVSMLKDLFARWELNMDEYMPGERTPGNLAPFTYLLDEYDRADSEQAKTDARRQLMEYVGRLTALEGR